MVNLNEAIKEIAGAEKIAISISDANDMNVCVFLKEFIVKEVDDLVIISSTRYFEFELTISKVGLLAEKKGDMITLCGKHNNYRFIVL